MHARLIGLWLPLHFMAQVLNIYGDGPLHDVAHAGRSQLGVFSSFHRNLDPKVLSNLAGA